MKVIVTFKRRAVELNDTEFRIDGDKLYDSNGELIGIGAFSMETTEDDEQV